MKKTGLTAGEWQEKKGGDCEREKESIRAKGKSLLNGFSQQEGGEKKNGSSFFRGEVDGEKKKVSGEEKVRCLLGGSLADATLAQAPSLTSFVPVVLWGGVGKKKKKDKISPETLPKGCIYTTSDNPDMSWQKASERLWIDCANATPSKQADAWNKVKQNYSQGAARDKRGTCCLKWTLCGDSQSSRWW